MMKNRIDVFFYKPRLEDLWFRQAMMTDPETMEYNRAWGGTIPFPCEKWAEWYDIWVQNPNKRFYRQLNCQGWFHPLSELGFSLDEIKQVHMDYSVSML